MRISSAASLRARIFLRYDLPVRRRAAAQCHQRHQRECTPHRRLERAAEPGCPGEMVRPCEHNHTERLSQRDSAELTLDSLLPTPPGAGEDGTGRAEPVYSRGAPQVLRRLARGRGKVACRFVKPMLSPAHLPAPIRREEGRRSCEGPRPKPSRKFPLFPQIERTSPVRVIPECRRSRKVAGTRHARAERARLRSHTQVFHSFHNEGGE